MPVLKGKPLNFSHSFFVPSLSLTNQLSSLSQKRNPQNFFTLSCNMKFTSKKVTSNMQWHTLKMSAMQTCNRVYDTCERWCQTWYIDVKYKMSGKPFIFWLYLRTYNNWSKKYSMWCKYETWNLHVKKLRQTCDKWS